MTDQSLPAAARGPAPCEEKRTVAARLFDGTRAESELEGKLGFDFDRLGWDPYDGSLEIHGVAPEFRLNELLLQSIRVAGFSKVYVNHVDKWETHYSFAADGSATPWRVSYPHKRGDGGSIWLEGRIPASWPDTAGVTVFPQGSPDGETPQAEPRTPEAPTGGAQ